MSGQPELPLRPMTLGELLDAAMALLRRRALPLFAAGILLAAAEQVALAPMRSWAHLTPPWYGPTEAYLIPWWITVAAGFGTELFVLTLLGAYAAAAAGPALLGQEVRHRALWRRSRPLAAAGLALWLGAVGTVGALLVVIPWAVFYGFFAMTPAALVIDRAKNPLGRAMRLAGRQTARGFWILITAYLTWAAVRGALGIGWTEMVRLITGAEPEFQTWVVPAARALGNGVAYAALACVSAVLVIDVRVRTEGLDILISRTRSLGGDVDKTLVHVP
ncbi:hypothetical protein [Actinoplanes sp. NBRC 103695]|uniref:hypothetical protein n=1 Tax=Actinoplanes sp. NBRC 103695 TaxID=3032202 RepID=UPI0024A34B0D|nr:hypothetical protein [Actinoplanes sp. NBRC 103695]GLY97723.1 hypothetical protein Acsp02_49770 [Actinoplanes sp. NBRC 103695]